MANKIPVDTLYYTTVVTPDAKVTAKHYAEFYGIKKWEVIHHTKDRLQQTTVHGRGISASPPGFDDDPVPGQYEFIGATGQNENGVAFRLVQPTRGLSTFEEFLVTRG